MGAVLMAEAGHMKTRSSLWPLLALLALLIAQAAMVFTRAVNWDEFFYYSQVHQYLRGDPIAPLQTMHVHLFGWLPRIADNPVDAIIAARTVMFACELVTLIMIALVAERFSDRTTGLIAALAYLSAGFVLQHGFSFRVDPPTTALLMSALAVLARTKLHALSIALFAVLIAIAGLFTIKIVLFAPAFAGIAWWRWSEAQFARPFAARLIAAAIAAVALFAAFYWLHAADLAGNAGNAAVLDQGNNVIASSKEAVFFIGIPPYAQMIAKAVQLSIVLTGLILLTPVALWKEDRARAAKLALIGLWLPVLTLAFYRNTAPYYYAFMLAPVAAACVPAIRLALMRVQPAVLCGAMAVLTIPVLIAEDRETIANQRIVIKEAGRMFDEPVAYFDHNGALAGYRKANGFMTPWGLEGYQAHGKSMFRTIMERRTVPLLFENDQLLSDLLAGEDGSQMLFPEDSKVLQGNYVRVWGPVWLAGKDLPAQSSRETEILVPGSYRAEGSGLSIDNRVIADGQAITLDRGIHTLANTGQSAGRLVWAETARMPAGDPPEGRIWIGF